MVEDRTYLLSRVLSTSRISEFKWPYIYPQGEDSSESESKLRNGRRALDVVVDDDVVELKDNLRRSKSLKLMGFSIYGNVSFDDANKGEQDQQQQQQQSDSNNGDGDSLINDIGRDNSISCLIRCWRSDYSSIASLNCSFWSLVQSGDKTGTLGFNTRSDCRKANYTI